MRSKFPPTKEVLVGYSGGKDSLVTLDLCIRAGLRVEAFFMYFIKGLDYTEYWCDYASRTWGVKVHQCLHWNTPLFLKNGIFRSPVDVPLLTIGDVELEIRQRSGIEWIGYGYKSNDSLERRGWLSMWTDGIFESHRRFAPIKDWTDKDVYAYLSRRRIKIPEFAGRRCNGIDLTPGTLEYLRDNWPADYRRILEVFPHAEAQAGRAGYIRQYERRQRRKNKAPDVPISGDPAGPDQIGPV